MAAGNLSGQQAPANQNIPATGSASNATPPSVSANRLVLIPTGSTQPDATTPVRSNPSGGGGKEGGSGGGAGR